MALERDIFQRTELLLGQETFERIASQRVIIFGVGGVGSWCAESLVRSGIQHLTIVDSDRVSVSNVNRQLMATTKTIGQVKVEVLKQRLLEINPSAEIVALQKIYSAETAQEFGLENYDYIIDAIDSLDCKCHLILYACQLKARFFSCMGAALKMDPTGVKVDEFWKVKGCPLAKAIRNKFKRNKTFPKKKFKCLYSEELLKNVGTCHEFADPDDMGTENKVSQENDKEVLATGKEILTDNNTNQIIGTSIAVKILDVNPNSQDVVGDPSLVNHDWSTSKAQINGTLCHTTAIFGFTLAGLVIQDIWKKESK